MKKLIFYFAILLGCLPGFSQAIPDPAEYQTSPNGYFDDVFDHYGNKYKLDDLKVYERSNGQYLSRNPMLCNSGIFELYFETGSGMEGSSSAEIARRAVVCQVFQDLSNFINSPLKNQGNPTKVKIWVRNINSAVQNPNGLLGLASSFYNVPYSADANFGGIADNEIWKTIHAGADSYINVASPLVSNSNEPIFSGLYYHGMMAFNFNSITWNTNLGINAPAGQYDLYTVVLHEVAHALGLASLINENGTSNFGTGFNYFTRYDRFLKNNSSTQFLINNTGGCSLYNYKFNTSLNASILHPGALPCVTDQTVCSTAIKYVGASNTIPVYTPNCFENGSSLSHFEDECVSPFIDNAYFVMSNANGSGVTKRFLKPEERGALCDIGYSVNTTYGDAAQFSYKNYGGTSCTGIQVAGINDGINNEGVFSFIGNINSNITISGILNNDFTTNTSDLRFECLQDVYDPLATFSVTSGTSATTVTFSSAVAGIHLLRYTPFNNITSQRGNITYIYVYVMGLNNCAVPNSCNLVMNGDFEQSSSFPSIAGQIDLACGWNTGNGATPDYYHANSTSPPVASFKVPCNYYGFQNDNIQGNNAYAGFVANNNHIYQENIVTTLSSPLLPNSVYQLSFDVSLAESISYRLMRPQVYLSNTYNITAGYGYIPITNQSMLYNSPILPSETDSWQRVKIIIQTGSVAGERFLYLGTLSNHVSSGQVAPGTAPGCNFYSSGVSNASYYYIDNIELVPLESASLNIPEDHCQDTVLPNLSSYVASAPSNGIFSGTGVLFSGGVYSFNAETAGLGLHVITYTYTDSAGCAITISSNVKVLDCTEEVEIPCPNALILTAPELATEEIYQDFGIITTHTNYIVNPGSDITFRSGNTITLNPNTLINYGSDFVAYIEQCTVNPSSRIMNTVKGNSRLDVYPNPTKGFVTISARDLKISKVMVTSLEGKIIHTRDNINNYSYDLTLENFQTGIYSVIVETVDGEVIIDKIIKN